MMRSAFNTTGTRMRSLCLKSSRDFTTRSGLSNKACVGQMLEQAQSAGPKTYKTVKEKGFKDNIARRNQLIWLVKHSFGKEAVGTKVSPHDLPWYTDAVVKQVKEEAALVDVTVWPHLWLVFRDEAQNRGLTDLQVRGHLQGRTPCVYEVEGGQLYHCSSPPTTRVLITKE